MKTMVSDRAVVSSGKMLTIGKGLDLGGKKARQESYGRTPKDSVNRAQAEEDARSDGVGRRGDPGIRGPRCRLSLGDVRNLEVIERPFPIVSWYQSSNATYEPALTYFEATSFNDVVNFGLTLEDVYSVTAQVVGGSKEVDTFLDVREKRLRTGTYVSHTFVQTRTPNDGALVTVAVRAAPGRYV